MKTLPRPQTLACKNAHKDAQPDTRSAAVVGWLANLLLVLFFVLCLVFLVVREVLVPRVQDYRPEIVAALEQIVGRPVVIDTLSADWQGLRPRLRLAGLSVLDAHGAVALRLDSVDATVAWRSLLRWQPHFHQLVIFSPELALRREADGQIFVAGIGLEPQASESHFAAWLLGQREVVVRDATLSWIDHLRNAPELRLADIDVRLDALAGRHRFGLHATRADAAGSRIEVRGDVVSDRPADPATWSGQLFMALAQVELGAWTAWVDYPVPIAGQGELRAWADIDRGALVSVVTDLALGDVALQFADDVPPLQLDALTGRVSAARGVEGVSVSARALQLVADSALEVGPLDFDLTTNNDSRLLLEDGSLSATTLDLSALTKLATFAPLRDDYRDMLARFAPGGVVHDFSLRWQGLREASPQWSVDARFSDLALNAHDVMPGVQNISGKFAGDQTRGRFSLDSRDVVLNMPRVFAEPLLNLATLKGEGGWSRHDQQVELAMDDLRFENADVGGSASGRYRLVHGGRGEIDVAARLTRADPAAVWRYVPLTVGPLTRGWLRAALTGGSVPDARFRLRGDLDDFPFVGGVDGQFLVTVRIADGTLSYAPGWPAIEGINGELRFEGPGMQIRADSAQMLGIDLNEVVADVPDLDARGQQVMTINGRAQGATMDFLRFVSASPVRRYIGGFTDGIAATGSGVLDLTLTMPLHHIKDTEVRGEYRFDGNQLEIMEGLPVLADARGRVLFSERSLSITDAAAQAFGEPLTLTATSQPAAGVKFAVQGGVSMQALRQLYDWPVLSHLSGTSAWAADIDVRKDQVSVSIASALDGISSSLPQPMNKRAVEQWPLHARIDFTQGGAREQVTLDIVDRLEVDLQRQRRGATWEVVRGGVGLFAPAQTMEGGVMWSAQLDALDLDRWRTALGTDTHDAAQPSAVGLSDLVAGVNVKVAALTAFGTQLSPFVLDARRDPRGWQGQLSSDQASGDFHWAGAGGGALNARFDHLTIGAAEDGRAATPVERAVAAPPARLPALDVVAERFSLRGKDLGRLRLNATNTNNLWLLDTLVLANPDGELNASGQWRAGADPQTDLTFSLTSGDIGRLMTRLGYPAVFTGGSAVVEGRAAWQGSPLRIDHPSLSGQLALEARNGRFRQLEPGVGRLLGVLSLQSLPRRLTLDFSDVFSEGFAFDLISGSISMASGVMHTDDLKVAGPAATVWVSGTSHLAKETQDLKVIVHPTLTESIAIGAAAGLINPVVGVVAYLAQRVLSDPIERMFAFTYAITGTWSDPKVEKLSGGQPSATP